jgi:hypothetical protein
MKEKCYAGLTNSHIQVFDKENFKLSNKLLGQLNKIKIHFHYMKKNVTPA